MDVAVRRYEPKDHATVVALNRTALDEAGAFDHQTPDLDADLNDIASVYLSGGGEFLVAETQDAVIGMGALRRVDDSTGELKRMRVAKSFQRRGIATDILNRLEHTAAVMGYRDLVLDTTVELAAARAFYEARGYVHERTEHRHGLELMYFRKRL